MNRKDLLVMGFVICVVIMLVIPMPNPLLDFLLIINLSLSLTILLVAMNTNEPVQFSIFPSLLLITTIFRLALNVSSTRNILSLGEAGNVIEAFGSFVISGNAIVGFVVFLILTLINFMVITKGSERVAEVAARFTLDAMPGKQMAIDADLNAGAISDAEAQARRKKISQESEFFGAMDGATKFVKGDAIAGIVIFIINIIGGLVIGMVIHGMDFAEAAKTFTLLSVGDGLVSQIPALLLSTATGIIVTRAASEDNIGDDLMKQMLSYPRLLYVVAATVALMGIFTPIGVLRTFPVAGVLAFGGFRLQKSIRAKEIELESVPEEADMEDVRSPESVVSLLYIDPIEFEFGYGLIPLADANQGGDLLDRVIMIRRQCALELGLVVPVIRIRDNIQLRPNEYVIKIKGNQVARGEIMLDHYLAMSPGIDDESVVGIETVEPAFGLPALWVTEEVKERAEMAGYTVVDPPSVVATHLTEIIKRYAHELLNRQETKALIDNVRETAPALVEELIPNIMGVGDVQKVLQKLLKEKISIRNLPTILETLADYGTYTKDTDLLTEYVRQALSRQITLQFANPGEPLQVITAGPSLEKAISDSIQQTEQGNYMAIDPDTSQRIFNALSEQVNRMLQMGQQPIILTSPAIRMYLRQLVERMMPEVPVLSYNELEPQIEIQSVGVVSI
ncbi:MULTISPECIES: flagellar biosynthesis protein FlhA [Aneurinibacillus]|uniref:Flagellar biosynthesis protein FlhA n=2 Tax=Bacillales TaxID=1385 RepID=A0A1G7WFR4_ANETH|nr:MULTISPECIES: flagellar biosynthesis protein FlhA [Aneurinibacillus]AMA72685.1 flagellar biosynthesis protein FlhA [Aneurinibacillus sp. XH2]MED0674597.1 flagellar biosynthesis protein FlhA [Aneurinibacillus thermoaerophilus]MED0677966.1 flagellar biosynthesis protein FlhA [Aneurinibacillus thermoaerophilus]MED0736971.1 flagellar biosynthesis protein FlhA [Aneurinibacillus thermoaerophilus]MED0756812.1 flagellar biosynthesis protein FlhA [Aneurinibacillus thermoaerophilus]